MPPQPIEKLVRFRCCRRRKRLWLDEQPLVVETPEPETKMAEVNGKVTGSKGIILYLEVLVAAVSSVPRMRGLRPANTIQLLDMEIGLRCPADLLPQPRTSSMGPQPDRMWREWRAFMPIIRMRLRLTGASVMEECRLHRIAILRRILHPRRSQPLRIPRQRTTTTTAACTAPLLPTLTIFRSIPRTRTQVLLRIRLILTHMLIPRRRLLGIRIPLTRSTINRLCLSTATRPILNNPRLSYRPRPHHHRRRRHLIPLCTTTIPRPIIRRCLITENIP
jgi:hypothetical protein